MSLEIGKQLRAVRTAFGLSQRELAKRAGVAGSSLAELAGHSDVHAYLQGRVDADCHTKVARYLTIKKVSILPNEFSVDGGELTPTMKVRRDVVVKKYADEIEALFR